MKVGTKRSVALIFPRCLFACLVVVLSSCSLMPPTLPQPDSRVVPDAPREFRAMWVATVANIDWPKRPDQSSIEQQLDIKRIVASAKRLRMNAIILQVRPSADAIYTSAIEPWSEYLTGVQGQAPKPFYDPLSLWISEAHGNGIELHAWFNPYRARHSAAKSLPAANHITSTRPDVAKAYGNQWWMDPGEPAAAQRLIDVVRDVVRRYDVDGVHIDDYFYPYPAKLGDGQPDIEFPDEPSWKRYVATGGKFSRADWRRDNVNRLVNTLNTVVHTEKAWVKFGISPFGLPRPDRRPEGITGFSQYDKLYADVELWWNEGWLDYLAPQLYWPIAQTAQSFPVLLDYWSRSNAKKRHLWPGIFTSRLDSSETSWSVDEIRQQIGLLRADAGTTGHIHFSAAAVSSMGGWLGVADMLARDVYATDALVPATPWLRPTNVTAQPPLLASLRCGMNASGQLPNTCHVDWGRAVKTDAFVTAIWAKYGTLWRFSVATNSSTFLPEQSGGHALREVVISRVDRYGVEGARSVLTRP